MATMNTVPGADESSLLHISHISVIQLYDSSLGLGPNDEWFRVYLDPLTNWIDSQSYLLRKKIVIRPVPYGWVVGDRYDDKYLPLRRGLSKALQILKDTRRDIDTAAGTSCDHKQYIFIFSGGGYGMLNSVDDLAHRVYSLDETFAKTFVDSKVHLGLFMEDTKRMQKFFPFFALCSCERTLSYPEMIPNMPPNGRPLTVVVTGFDAESFGTSDLPERCAYFVPTTDATSQPVLFSHEDFQAVLDVINKTPTDAFGVLIDEHTSASNSPGQSVSKDVVPSRNTALHSSQGPTGHLQKRVISLHKPPTPEVAPLPSSRCETMHTPSASAVPWSGTYFGAGVELQPRQELRDAIPQAPYGNYTHRVTSDRQRLRDGEFDTSGTAIPQMKPTQFPPPQPTAAPTLMHTQNYGTHQPVQSKVSNMSASYGYAIPQQAAMSSLQRPSVEASRSAQFQTQQSIGALIPVHAIHDAVNPQSSVNHASAILMKPTMSTQHSSVGGAKTLHMTFSALQEQGAAAIFLVQPSPAIPHHSGVDLQSRGGRPLQLPVQTRKRGRDDGDVNGRISARLPFGQSGFSGVPGGDPNAMT